MYIDLFDQTETVRLTRLRHDLQTDKVLTAGQVWERYRLSPGVLREAGFTLSWERWKATPDKVKDHAVTCVMLEPRPPESKDGSLRRDTGLAEIRYLLREPSGSWKSPEFSGFGAGALPDIICDKRPDNPDVYAVVYVLGKSGMNDLLRRARALEGSFPTILWGVVSEAKQAKLERCLSELTSSAKHLLLCAPYAPELFNPYRYAYPCDDPETRAFIEQNPGPRWPWLQSTKVQDS